MTLPSEAQLRELGLDPTRLGESVTLPWPGEGVAHGRAPADTAMDVATIVDRDYAGVHFAPASVPPAQALRLSIHQAEEDARIVKVTGPPDAPLEVRMLAPVAGRPAAWARDLRDPATVLLDVRPATSAGGLVLLPEGEGLLITEAPEGLVVFPVFREGLAPPPFPEIGSPLLEWLGPRHARWLRAEIHARLERADPWQHAVAVGLFARLAVAADRPPTDVAGGDDLARPRRWARRLAPPQVATLALLLKAEAVRLLDLVADLAEAMACDEDGWRAELAELCRGRDDLEGVRLLLQEAGAGETVADAVGLLDEAGARFLGSVPVRLVIDDVRLREAAAFDPGAWWAAPARRGA
jgi:hypothetical protein